MLLKSIIFVCFLFVLVLFVESAFVQEIEIAEFGFDEEQVIAASKKVQRRIESPSVASVINNEQMNNYGWMSMNDILYKLPGFVPSQDYDRRTVSSRGIFEGWNNNHYLLLIDGIPYNDNLYGTAYTWEITPLFFTKSLEIIRGPGSALYGSNATNGLLAINTISSSDIKNLNEVKISYGNYGTQVYDVLSGTTQKNFSIVVGYNTYKTNGNEYLSFDGSGRTDTLTGNLLKFKTKDARKSNYLFTKLDGKEKLEGLSLQFHHHQWSFQTGHGWIWHIPDFDESMNESRNILTLSYKPVANGDLSQEYAIRYQRHNIDWNQRYYPNNTYYKNGMWEYLNTYADDVFSRAQLSYNLKSESNIIAGLENTVFLYSGDNEHYSNVNINSDGDFAEFPGNQMQPLKPWFEWIKDEPVVNVGVFGQFISGRLLGNKLSTTLGVRYDRQSFKFTAIDKPTKPKKDKSFSQVSPRVGFVYLVNKSFAVKTLAGRAFRSPSPTELFGSNTYSLASNIYELKPEIITTYELAEDWNISKNLNWRVNGFYTKFENQIAYSIANYNLSTNIYTLTTMGLETEFLFNYGKYAGFLNYSLSKRLDESIIDTMITVSKNKLTWYPTHSSNFGLTYNALKFGGSLVGHYNGKVNRRLSDIQTQVNRSLRPNEIKGWFSLDVKAYYKITNFLSLGFSANNVFDAKNMLIKNMDYPFDYQMEGRRLLANLQIVVK